MKKLIALFLAAMMLLSLAACAGKAAPDTEEPNAPAAQTPAEDSAGDTAETNGKTIHYWSCWNETEPQAEAIKRTIERFESDTGYTVEVRWLGRDINKTAGMSIDAGEAIDVYDADAALLTPDNAMDIDAIAAELGLKDDILPAFTLWQESVSPVADNHWYAVPYQPFVGALFYNKAIFREAGVDALPETWDEFLDVCAKIKAAGYDPMTVDDAYVVLLYMQELGLCMGNEAACALGTSTGEAWNNDTVREVMTKWQEFTELGYFSSTVGGNQYPAAQNSEMALGTAAMYFNGSWLPGEVASITGDDFEWGAMFLPSMNGNESRIPMIGCCELAVSPKTEDPEGSVLFLKYLTDAQTCQDLADTAMSLPLVSGVEFPAALADTETIFTDAKGAFRWQVWSASVTSEVQILADTYFHELIGGNCTADEFIQHMVDGQ